MWKKFLRNYFTFNRRERNGLIVLLLVMMVITFWPTIYSWCYKDPPADFTAFQQAIDSFQLIIHERSDTHHGRDTDVISLAGLDYSPPEDEKPKDHDVTLFPFNPNTLDEAGWRSLGVADKTIRTIIKYRSKGGKFFRKHDLKKIYGFSETDYSRLEPFIELSTTVAAAQKSDKEKEKSEFVPAKKLVVELNEADSVQLVVLNGIGPVLSSRILKYRNKLGGFVLIDQLKEVYGFTPESFDMVKDQLTVDAELVKKVAINAIKEDELKQHPYFRNPLASMVINYRDQHGPFEKPEDLKNVELITDSVYRKIIPYIAF